MVRKGPRSALRDFLEGEASGGLLLIGAALLALLAANLPATRELYAHFVHARIGPMLSPKLGPMDVHLWVNDGLMALFFLLVGLEIKREVVDGQLSRAADRRLPIVAAAAGMAAPALIYLAITRGTDGLFRGWAIPAATDIAFAIGVLALLGKRAPSSLKLFLTTVAIVDDMGAVAIIAAVYTEALNMPALAGAAVVLAVMIAMNRLGVTRLWPYWLASAALWYLVLVSGVHATVAGVLAALTIPIKPSPGAPDARDSPLHRMEHGLHRWVAFGIVPLFGFVNAGVAFGGAPLLAPLPLGIIAGLFVGKQLGVFGAVWATVRLGWTRKPAGASWVQIYGVALLCGIGFTMSLFIGGLAFGPRPEFVDAAKIGILCGSLLSALAGWIVLRFFRPSPLAGEGGPAARREGEGSYIRNMHLSVLDQSPIPAGGTAADAVRNTIALAQAAERLGYHRYWLAEHHASPALAGVAPEALIGPVALATARIRVGSGGIMLPHYSPFKVAETFRLLGAIAPGRIDLGLGRAPGSDQRTAYAMQRDRSQRMQVSDFPEQVTELLGYLEATLPDDHLFKPLETTMPGGTAGAPEVWMLGSSSDSAVWAGQMGLPYCIADFINSDAVPLANLYRQHFKPSSRCPAPYVTVAVWAIAATDRAEAERLAGPARMMFAHLVRGSLIPVPTVDEAEAWLAANPLPPARRRTLLGTGAEVAEEVKAVAQLYGAQEMMLVNILPEHAPRVRSYELVAEAFGRPESTFVSSEVEKRA